MHPEIQHSSTRTLEVECLPGTPSPTETFPLEMIARRISSHGLSAPVVFCLECLKPFVGFSYVVIEAALPLLSAVLGRERADMTLEFLRSPQNIEALLVKIEQISNGESEK